jgi:hypothetical protein
MTRHHRSSRRAARRRQADIDAARPELAELPDAERQVHEALNAAIDELAGEYLRSRPSATRRRIKPAHRRRSNG